MFSYYDEEEEPVMETPSNDGKENVEEIKKESNDIQKQMDKLKFRLATIQASCRHSEKEIKFINDNGRQELRWVCTICNKAIAYPTPEDVKKFLH